jgi:hypothetical protein
MNCPQCKSVNSCKAGFRDLANGERAQRFLCRDCGHRFSEENKSSNSIGILVSNHQVGVILQDAKNLDSQAETNPVCAGLEKLPQNAKSLIIKSMAYLEKEGYYNDSTYVDLLKSLILHDGVNLLDPEDVKTKIARHKGKTGEPWRNATKMLATYAYNAFCIMQKIEWTPPHYKQEETVLTVADEKDLDCFIASANKRMAAFYLTLKETFADPGEILRAERIDLKESVLSINHPVKGHLPGYSELSPDFSPCFKISPKRTSAYFPCLMLLLEAITANSEKD